MKCLHCGTENFAGVKFCNRCGQPLVTPASQPTVMASTPGAAPGSPTWRLAILQGPLQGQSFPLGAHTTLGRDPASTIVLENPKVSRGHAVIEQKAGEYILTDQGSSNGTYLNGKLITKPTRLASGDTIDIGDTRLSVQGPPTSPRFVSAGTGPVPGQQAGFPTSSYPPQAPPPPPPPPPGATGARRSIWVWLVGGVLFVGLIGIAGLLGTTVLKKQPAPTATVRAISTATLAPPSPTVTPSATSASTPTPTPTPSATATLEPTPTSSQTTTLQPLAPSETVLPTQGGGEIPPEQLQAMMANSKILLYEDIVVARYVEQALDLMGLPYTDVSDRVGDFKAELLSGTKWDLVLAAVETRSAVQGEFFVYLNDQLTQGAAVVLEIWNLDKIGGGQARLLLSRCGLEVQGNWFDPPQRSVWWLVPDHPIFHEPNEGISLTHFSPFWTGDVGDLLRKSIGSEATLLAGTIATEKNGYATLATCLGGRFVLQTFSTHDFKPEDMVRLWQNYIYFALKNSLLARNALP